jgi:hypothetical protein
VLVDQHDVGRDPVAHQRVDVVAQREGRGLGQLGVQVGHVDGRGRGAGEGLGDPWDDARGEHAGEERTRADEDDVGALDRLDGGEGRGGVGRLEADAPDRRGSRHLALSARRPLLGAREQHDALAAGRDDRPGHAHHLGDGAHRLLEVARRVDQADQQQVAHGVAVEFAHAEAVLEGLRERVLGVGQRAQALAQVPHRRHVQHRAQPARRPAVVGDRDDAGHVVAQLAQRPQRDGGAVAPTHGDDPHRAMSR